MSKFEPVKGTTWERTSSVHAGSLYLIDRASDVSVRVRETRSNHGGSLKAGARHTWSREQFLAMFRPATTRDERLCSPKIDLGHGVKVLMDEPPKTVEDTISLLEREEVLGVRLTPSVADIASSGEQIEVPIAKRRCNDCGLEKARGLFDLQRNRKDGLSPVCKECKKKRNADYQARLRAQRKGDGPVITTTDNHIIEQRKEEAVATIVESKPEPVQDKRPTKVFRVRAMVYEEREFKVEARDIPEAYSLIQQSGVQVEIVSVGLDG
jgi:superfamily II helicase